MSIWNDDYEQLLNYIRLNSVIMSKYHKRKYYKFKAYLKYFRIPIIILSSCNSVFAVSNFIPTEYISTVTCLISLGCGIIGSVELFLQIQQQMESDLSKSKDFYMLSIDIYKMLNLVKEHRPCDQSTFLDKSYTTYCKIIEQGTPLKSKIIDYLSTTEINGIVTIEKKDSFFIPFIKNIPNTPLNNNSVSSVCNSLETPIYNKDKFYTVPSVSTVELKSELKSEL